MALPSEIWVIDSIEESTAAIEVDGSRMIHIPRSMLPANAKEGNVLRVSYEAATDGTRAIVSIVIDADETRRRLDASARQVRGRRSPGDPGGDIKL